VASVTGACAQTEALLEALSRVRAELPADAIVASDGDGTLWRGDIGEALFERAIDRGLLRDAATEALRREARVHGVALGAARDPNEIGRALLAAMRRGSYEERHAFSMMAWAFAGWSATELGSWSARLLDDLGFERALRSAVVAAIEWARGQGVPFWLVSASPSAVVRAAARRAGVDADRVVAMQPAVVGDQLQPALAAEPTYGEGKLRRLRQRTGAPLLAAFGDSGYDAAMLCAAALPVAVAPSAALRRALGDEPATVWLAGEA